MAITVTTQSIQVQAPIVLTMTDASGAHVELTVSIDKLPPIHHAFAFTEGTVTVPLPDLAAGLRKGTLIVQAFKHSKTPNRMYDVQVRVNGSEVASARGQIAAGRSNDVGFGDFDLTVA